MEGVICEDPRQFVPDSGQGWTTLSDLMESRTHKLTPDKEDARVRFIHTEPAFGINQTRRSVSAKDTMIPRGYLDGGG